MRYLTESDLGIIDIIISINENNLDSSLMYTVEGRDNLWIFHSYQYSGKVLVYQKEPKRIIDYVVCQNRDELIKRIPEFELEVVGQLV